MKATGKVALLQTAPLAISVTSSDISQEWSCVTGGQNCKDQIWPFRSEINIIIGGRGGLPYETDGDARRLA